MMRFYSAREWRIERKSDGATYKISDSLAGTVSYGIKIVTKDGRSRPIMVRET
jgi:hypothetical protein